MVLRWRQTLPEWTPGGSWGLLPAIFINGARCTYHCKNRANPQNTYMKNSLHDCSISAASVCTYKYDVRRERNFLVFAANEPWNLGMRIRNSGRWTNGKSSIGGFGKLREGSCKNFYVQMGIKTSLCSQFMENIFTSFLSIIVRFWVNLAPKQLAGVSSFSLRRHEAK
jgi:hypothetical protein